jgi:uncharacterized protein (TIGR02246 family)
MRNTILIVLIAATTLFCSAQQDATAGQAAKKAGHSSGATAELSRLRDQWKTAFNNKQANQVAAMYADDAVMSTPEGSASGRDAIKAAVQKSIDAGDQVTSIDSQHSEVSGNLMYDTGTFTEKANGKDVTGHYVVVLKKEGGKWLLVAHNSVIPQQQ